jgi:sec-independent protein translocase protein TatA
MFGIGPWEMAILGLVALLLFGNQLPKVARSLGQSLKELKKAAAEIAEDK